MSNSIIHVGPVGQNLGALYSNAYSQKRPKKVNTTPGKAKKKKHHSSVKRTRPAFYRSMARTGRRLLDTETRKKRSHQLANSYGPCAISESSILKVLDAYYYCCKEITQPDKQKLQIESSLKNYLIRMKVDSRVIKSILEYDYIPDQRKSSKKVKVPPTSITPLTNISYYELHLCLCSSKKQHYSIELIQELKQNHWSDQYINKLVRAYRYGKNNPTSLKNINQEYQLGIYQRDITALDKFW